MSKRRLLKRLLGSFLVGWVVGCPLDLAFQLFALGFGPDRLVFPAAGLLLLGSPLSLRWPLDAVPRGAWPANST